MPTVLLLNPDQHQHRARASTKEIELVGKPSGSRHHLQAGLATSARELPAVSTLVVDLAGNGVAGRAPRGELQTAAIPKAGVVIKKADVIGSVLDHLAGLSQIEHPVFAALVPPAWP